ncbi:MAG: M15 family metallopeptidase [bacterium]|nr:M15 family metallopeptidase [bacterium]
MTPAELTGKTRQHILQVQEPRFAAAPLAVRAFIDLRQKARKEGIELGVFSGFRDFESQARIWRLKLTGQRPLYDTQGKVLDFESLSPEALVLAILRWSALPGASRHHWGSELDLIDLAALPPGYQVQLLPEEYANGGVFEKLNRWLDHNLSPFGFFRPYARDLGGVAPEPWHVSFAEISGPALACLTPQLVAQAWDTAELPGREWVLPQLDDLFERFVKNITLP